MVRWLLIVLLFALPAQFVSAAVATYCGHEPMPSSFHIGHHAHEHDDTIGAAHAAASQEMGNEPVDFKHADCSSCHVSVAQLSSPAECALGNLHESSFAGSHTEPFTSSIEEDIDRPKWARAG